MPVSGPLAHCGPLEPLIQHALTGQAPEKMPPGGKRCVGGWSEAAVPPNMTFLVDMSIQCGSRLLVQL